MNKNFKAGGQGGFTLIELIVVIVILGILAATALPKFANLGSDARVSSVQAARGALSATSAMLHGKFLIAGGNSVSVDGLSVTLTNGYPTASGANLANLTAVAGLNDYKTSIVGGNLRVAPASATNPATCNLTYANAVSDGGVPATITPPVMTVTTTDCN